MIEDNAPADIEDPQVRIGRTRLQGDREPLIGFDREGEMVKAGPLLTS
jgi:hypothetical protein